MLKLGPMLAAVALIAGAVASCVADVSDETDDVGSAAEPGVHHGQGAPGHREPPFLDDPAAERAIPPGPCRTACRQVMSEGCNDWEAECSDAWPDDEEVTCGDQYLTCAAARHAVQGTLAGQMWCYRACMNLD